MVNKRVMIRWGEGGGVISRRYLQMDGLEADGGGGGGSDGKVGCVLAGKGGERFWGSGTRAGCRRRVARMQ